MDGSSAVLRASLSGLVMVSTSPSRMKARHSASFTRLAVLDTGKMRWRVAVRSASAPPARWPDGFVVADASAPHAAAVLLCGRQTGPCPARHGFREPKADGWAVVPGVRREGSAKSHGEIGSSNSRPRRALVWSLFPTFCRSKAITL